MDLNINNKKLISLFIVVFIFQKTIAQNNEPKTIPLSHLLIKISDKHQIFFTYNTSLLLGEQIQAEGFTDLSLKESLSLLKKLTPFKIDDLGNNYYVIYNKNTAAKNSKKTIEEKKSDNDSIAKKITKTEKITVKGIVLSSENKPLHGATLLDEHLLIGTTTNLDGTFEFQIYKDNLVKISFLGHNSKTLKLIKDKFYTITLFSGQELDEVQIVGSRNKKRVANDTPVAIDFIDIETSSSKSSQVEINQFLQYVIPSFNATKQSGADGSDHIDPATLRGLGPDQSLILINGKRRHQASLVNLYGTRGRGNSGTDLNAIPISAIKRIELLRDGASAQYGSDAIAGVLNIVLKDADDKLNVSTTIGLNNANSDNNLPSKVDGFTSKLSLNYGTKINKGGFINLTTEALSKDKTFRNGTSIREKYGQASIQNVSLFLNTEIPIYNN